MFLKFPASNLCLLTALLFAALPSESAQQRPLQTQRLPSVLAVGSSRESAPDGVADLKFGELFKMPVGPRGLEPTEKLLGLNGKRVRLVGFMVRQDIPTRGMFVFAAMPLELGDQDESLSDDLPPGAVFVHIAKPADAQITYIPALMKLTGTLQMGPQNEPDGHVSFVRLLLDEVPARALVRFSAAPAKPQ